MIVDSQQLDDAAAAKLCRDIARSIQEQLTYPGEVKVTVLRETRFDGIRPLKKMSAAMPLKVLFIGDVVGSPGPQDRRPGPAAAHPALGASAWSSATPRTPPAARG